MSWGNYCFDIRNFSFNYYNYVCSVFTFRLMSLNFRGNFLFQRRRLSSCGIYEYYVSFPRYREISTELLLNELKKEFAPENESSVEHFNAVKSNSHSLDILMLKITFHIVSDTRFAAPIARAYLLSWEQIGFSRIEDFYAAPVLHCLVRIQLYMQIYISMHLAQETSSSENEIKIIRISSRCKNWLVPIQYFPWQTIPVW